MTHTSRNKPRRFRRWLTPSTWGTAIKTALALVLTLLPFGSPATVLDVPPPPKSDTDEQARQEKIKEAEQLRKLERWQLPKGPDDKMWTRVDIPSTGPAYETTPEERERAWRAIIEDVKDMVEFDDSSEKRREPADDEAY